MRDESDALSHYLLYVFFPLPIAMAYCVDQEQTTPGASAGSFSPIPVTFVTFVTFEELSARDFAERNAMECRCRRLTAA
jgi:hypothetical protein